MRVGSTVTKATLVITVVTSIFLVYRMTSTNTAANPATTDVKATPITGAAATASVSATDGMDMQGDPPKNKPIVDAAAAAAVAANSGPAIDAKSYGLSTADAAAASAAATAAATAGTAASIGHADFRSLGKVAPIADGVFRLQIASDLHLEMFDTKPEIIYRVIKPTAPYLALLGDIGCPGILASPNGLPIYERFLTHLSAQFERVFVLSGNHEFYIHSQAMTITPKTVAEIDAIIQQTCGKLPNVTFLNRSSAVVDGVRLIGATLWSHIPPDAMHEVGSRMNDYNLIYTARTPEDAKKYPRKKMDFNLPPNIRRFHPDDGNAIHDRDLAFIKAELAAAATTKQPAIVLTHHAPLMRGTSDPQFEPPVTLDAKLLASWSNPSQHAFATDLDALFDHKTNPQYSALKAWGFGHTHFCVKSLVHGIPLLANQRGYEPKEVDPKYKPDFMIEIANPQKK